MREHRNDLCLVTVRKRSRHPDGYLHNTRLLPAHARFDLPMLDSISIFVVDNEPVEVLIKMRVRGDEGFVFEMTGPGLRIDEDKFLRLREYLESAGITEVEAHILANNIIGSVRHEYDRAAVESEAA